jgi:hypothetical protein
MTKTKTTMIPDAIAEAARWHLVARLFERPRAGWVDDVRALAREIADPVLRAIAAGVSEASEGAYLGIFGPGGRVSPREAGHAGFRDPGWILADLARCYDAFGYAPRAEDPLDHLAVEAGFVAYLHLKEARARACADQEAGEVTRAAREAFAREHLAPLAAGLAVRLADEEPTPFAATADWLVAHLPLVEIPTAGAGASDPLAQGCGACVPPAS